MNHRFLGDFFGQRGDVFRLQRTASGYLKLRHLRSQRLLCVARGLEMSTSTAFVSEESGASSADAAILFASRADGWASVKDRGVGWLWLDGRIVKFAHRLFGGWGASLTALDLADEVFIGSIGQRTSISPSFANDRTERGGRELFLKLLRSLSVTVGTDEGCLHCLSANVESNFVRIHTTFISQRLR